MTDIHMIRILQYISAIQGMFHKQQSGKSSTKWFHYYTNLTKPEFDITEMKAVVIVYL
jgi:hypothetical protein